MSDRMVGPNRQRPPAGLDPELPLGAHRITARLRYDHHGVYAGDGRVVHYSGLLGSWPCGPVEEVSLSQFVNGDPVPIVEHLESRCSHDEIVRRARSPLGENDYRLLTNSCEHFCNGCVSGISRSAQVQRRLHAPFRKRDSFLRA